uniref:Uncharacterized protein n=1 Tax=Arundo donax TaxID=35708 RepID=A0A0A9HAS1_ARUDO
MFSTELDMNSYNKPEEVKHLGKDKKSTSLHYIHASFICICMQHHLFYRNTQNFFLPDAMVG